MLDDADDNNVLMMLMTILMQLPLADNDDGDDVANENDPKPTNKNKLKQNSKMPKEEGRIHPSSADSPTMVTKNMQRQMSRENNNIRINAQQQAQCIVRISLAPVREI